MRQFNTLRVTILLLLLTTFSVQVKAQTPDPGLPGIYPVSKLEYNLGDTAVLLPGYPAKVEVIGSVHYPTTLTGGPFPVLFFEHGRHSTCWDTTNPNNTSSDWPCTGTYVPITSYEGYDYLARQMASHGYIVVSLSCNAINAGDDTVYDAGMTGRGQIMEYHMRLWDTINRFGRAPFDTMFVGKLNMQNIGTMGHSRGGEGAIYNALYNRSLGSPFGIKAVLTLAPVDFYRHVLNGIPLMDVSPYCDGDVNDIQGVHFYDDSRYIDTSDQTPKHTVLFMGANHDFFNTVWTPGSYSGGGGWDDWLYGYSDVATWCGASAPATGRFDTTVQMAALKAYMSAFYRVYNGHENKFAPIINVDNMIPPASSMLNDTQVYIAYHPGAAYRLDIDRTDSSNRTTINTLTGPVTDSGLVFSTECGAGFAMADCNVSASAAQEPHKGSSGTPGVGEANMRWNDTTEWYQNDIPQANEDFTSYYALQFRTSVNFRYTPTGENLNFTVELEDSMGNKNNQLVSNYSKALFYQPGTEPGDLPKVMLNTVKIPLGDFFGVNLAKIKFIRFKYNKMLTGAVVVSDIAAVRNPCGHYASFTDSVGARYHVIFTNHSKGLEGDSLTYYWNFGDTLSPASTDTSTLVNPTHIYAWPGNYYVCLSVKSYQANGYICTDTFCQYFTLLTDGLVAEPLDKEITIVPNPAKESLHFIGASKNDVLTLVNMYGQTVLTASLTQPDVLLPGLPAGIYCAVISTSQGKVYKKVVITE